jgi:7-cyano-7-deazaguanine synthase
MSRVCALVSGGLDSAALIARALEEGDEVHPLFVRCGFVWERAELHAIRRQLRALRGPRLKPLAVVDASGLCRWPEHWSHGAPGTPAADSPWDSVYLPGRNLLLIVCAATYCRRRRVGRIQLGTLKGNPFADATTSFRRAAGLVAGASYGLRLKVEAPFSLWTKGRVARRWPELVPLSFSCLRPRGLRACGRCSKCEERLLEAA